MFFCNFDAILDYLHLFFRFLFIDWLVFLYLQNVRQSSKESTGSSDSDSSSDDESTQTGATNIPTVGTLPPEKMNHQKESEAGAEISALVNYVQPVHFTSFEASESEIKTFCNNFF